MDLVGESYAKVLKLIDRARQNMTCMRRLTAQCALSLAGYSSCACQQEQALPPASRTGQLRVLRLFEPVKNQAIVEKHIRDAVLLLPAALAPSERRLLIHEADHLLAAPGGYARDRYDTGDEGDDDDSGVGALALRRVSLCDMSADARAVSDRLLHECVLPALRAELPSLSIVMPGAATPGAGQAPLELEYASDEPSVNVYTPGGAFEAHEDGYALTVIVLLSEDGAFDGGGTAFWAGRPTTDASAASAASAAPVRVHVSSPPGAALMFDGDLKHAGAHVVSGTRHLYVASFNRVHNE